MATCTKHPDCLLPCMLCLKDTVPLPMPPARTKPTFDEWHVRVYGASFDVLHMNPTQEIHVSLRRLTERLREYVSDLVLP